MLTILPSAVRRAASASRATRKGPRAFVSKTASHWPRVKLSSGADSKTAALFTRMSRRPKQPTVAATAERTKASERTSHSTASARRPRLSISLAVWAASSREVSEVMATSAPACARASAIPRPTRRAPPVTSADLPRRGWFVIALHQKTRPYPHALPRLLRLGLA